MLAKTLLGVVFGLLLGMGTAQGQEIMFIKVAEVNRLLKQGAPVLLVDVRTYQEHLARHIKGAISVPLNAIDERDGEIPKHGLVALY